MSSAKKCHKSIKKDGFWLWGTSGNFVRENMEVGGLVVPGFCTGTKKKGGGIG